ncbi:Hsp70 family protein [Anaerolineales bacterium HSG24]|nr:Hsp70 family protein [Anaerolineales bacterium HSG24]
MEKISVPIIGIDLGTTYTVCAYYDQEEKTSKILPIEQPWNGWEKDKFKQSKQLSSTVFLHQSENALTYAYVGHFCNELRKYPVQDQTYRLFKSIKRQMGTGWKTRFNDTIWTPPIISGIILKTVSNSVQSYFGCAPEHVVITVPAAFSTEQRRETIAAAKLAGFDHKKIRLIDEPTAALLYYIVKNPQEFINQEQKYITMLDIGGGTFDVSIIEVSGSNDKLAIDTIACSRYNEVAGDDFDLNLAALLLEKMKGGLAYFEGLDKQEQRNFAWRLLAEAERIKKEISISASQKSKVSRIELKRSPPESPYRIDELPQKRRLADTIIFQELTAVLEPYFYLDKQNKSKNLYYPTIYKPILEAFDTANKVLEMTDFGHDTIDKVFCTGGSSRLYHFQEVIGKFFGQQPKIIDPDFAVARGASLFYPITDNKVTIGEQSIKISFKRRLFDGVYLKSEKGKLLEIIPPNIPIPSERGTQDIGLVMPRQDYRLTIEVYIGRGSDDSLMLSCPKQEIHFSNLIPENTPIHIGYTITDDNQVHLAFTTGNHEGKLQIVDDYNLGLDKFRLPEVNRVSR